MVRLSPVPAKWPTAIATVADVGLFTNEVAAVLTADALIADTILDVDDASLIEANEWLYAMAKDGPLLMQVTAVNAGAKQVTVTRAKDGTTDVDLKQGDQVYATVPALALNQLTAEVISLETFLGIAGDTLTWDRALRLRYTGTTSPTLEVGFNSTKTDPETIISFTRTTDGGATWPEVGAIKYDPTNDQLEFIDVAVTIGSGASGVFEDDRTLSFGTDLDASFAFDSAADRVEYRSSKVLRFETAAAAEALTLTPGTRLNLVGAFSIGGTDLFESDRDLAISLIPNGDDTLDLGSATRRWRDLYLGPGSLRVVNASGDANSIVQVDETGYRAGAGGASALDLLLARQASSLWKVTGAIAGDVRFGMSGAATPVLEMRAATADANPLARVSTTALLFGLGGASALDVQWKRSAAAAWMARDGADAAYASIDILNLAIGATTLFEADRDLAVSLLPNADNTLTAGSAARRWSSVNSVAHQVFNAASDANAIYALLTTGLRGGAGGASALDAFWARQAISVWEVTGALAGSVRVGMTGAATPVLEGRLAAADAQPAWQVTPTGILLGPGGAVAPNAGLAWGATDRLDVLSGDSLNLVSGEFRVGNVAIFEADRDLGISLIPSVDGTPSIGSAARRFVAGHFSTFIAVGTNPATGGTLRLPNGATVQGRNIANSADLTLIQWDAADRVYLSQVVGINGQSTSNLDIGDNDNSVKVSILPGTEAVDFHTSSLQRVRIDSSGNLDIIGVGAFHIASVTVFENDRDLAISLIPNADASLNLGSATRNFANLFIRGVIDTDAVTGLKIGAGATELIGFYGAAPVARSAAYTQTYATATRTHLARVAGAIVNSIGLAQNLTIEDMPALQATPTGMVTGERTAIRNNFSDIAEQLIDLKADIDNTAQVLNQLVDDLQALGVLA